jgi:putative phage-type endonuclease
MNPVTHNQGSDAWKAWRRLGVGGSDVSAILGLSPYTDPPHTRETVLAEKVTGVEREGNFAMHRGTRFEPSARLAYEQRHRCTAPPVCVEMAGCPWARVSLDGLCSTGAVIAPERWVLELKCPSWETHNLTLCGHVAEHFGVQVQWQLLVCGLERCDFASFNPHERFTPPDFPLLAPWRERCEKWKARPKCDRGHRPELLELWLELPPARRPPMPEEWLAVVPVAADAEAQAWIYGEAAQFWFEVLEARAARESAAKVARVEAQFA